MDSTSPGEIARNALQANKDHQYALQIYAERLESELENVNKLIVCTMRVRFLRWCLIAFSLLLKQPKRRLIWKRLISVQYLSLEQQNQYL